MSPDTAVVESAIPTWLQTERTVPPVKGPDYKPAFELYTSRFPRDTKDLVMAIIGAQYAPSVSNDGQAISSIMAFITKGEPECSPGFYETAAVTDQDDYYNVAVIMYWKSKAAHEKWAVTSGFHQWWNNLKSGQYHHGWFLEVFLPTIERLETVVTTEWPQGISHLRDEVSGPIREHVYWGSMRDRFPISQVDTLAGEPSFNSTKDSVKNKAIIPGRIRARGRKNLVVIRSGQDWAEAAPEEREMYINDMQPALTAGMDFLRDSGDEVGCFSCRFMSVVDPKKDFSETEATFGLAYFDSLESLENWSKSHRTHLRIFAEFSKYAKAMGEDMSLKLFHEVFVLEPEQQLFEYIDCHRQTGMLGTGKTA
jgi:heme-degrading monooxygenase HmoA